MTMHRNGRARAGTIIMIMLGLITVMIVVAFGFVRSMQQSLGTSRAQHQDDLARQAAEMGLQHAYAVCLHEYAMDSEKVDGAARSGAEVATRLDDPALSVFDLLSPRENTAQVLQRPREFDLAPDVPFNDLFNNYGGTYHIWSAKDSGWCSGFTQHRGYARWFEANRFAYARGAVFDPASYDDYDPTRPPSFAKAVPPVPGGVSTPFPVVDPFTRGVYAAGRGAPQHPLDHPLWLDNELRPVSAIERARFRLRYAVCAREMSGALWLNTDMPWLAEPAKASVRRAYKDAVEAVGVQLVSLSPLNGTATIKRQYPGVMESVFLGYGPQNNTAFPRKDGIPRDWPTRADHGFDTPNPAPAAMAYRSPYIYWGSDIAREFHCILGSPYMSWFDPAGTWLGSPIASYTDLAFAVLPDGSDWQHRGELAGARADDFAQRAGTPFGRPYESWSPPGAPGEGHPWTVNVLTAPARVLQAMVSAYVPPAVRGVLISTEAHVPWYQFTDGSGNVNSNYGVVGAIQYGRSTWTGNEWRIPVADAVACGLSVAGQGIDVFTDSFRPYGRQPFAYPEPPNRDYWGSAPEARPDFTPAPDARGDDARYPGTAFFSAPSETEANRLTQWKDASTDPRQVESEPSRSRIPAAANGVDHLARHIVFYLPNATVPAAGGAADYLTANAALATNWVADFTPTTPSGCYYGPPGSCAGMSLYLPASETLQPNMPVPVQPDTELYPGYPSDGSGPTVLGTPLPQRPGVANPDGWRIIRRAGTGSTDPVTTARNSYWQRLSLAFWHAVAVTQVANLAWANPQDTRSQSVWQPLGRNFTGGPTYDPLPTVAGAIVRKAPGLDPKAADFATAEQVDRQFLANLGESFDHPGRVKTSAALAERPPRYLRYQCQSLNYPGPSSYDIGGFTHVAEYRVTNNIRTLLTPTSGALAASSRADQDPAAVPRALWLLDEWNAGNDAGYSPGAVVGAQPTRLARARAKLMERVLNDWRMSFLGASRGYAPSFHPKDFDGDGVVFCSGYLDGAVADADTGLTCWRAALAGGGDGPGVADPEPVTVFSVTGSLAFTRAHQYKIEVRGELFDNILDRAVNEHYLQSTILIDPDANVGRGGLATGLEDTTVIQQRPIHNYYRGWLEQAYQ